MVHQDAVGYLNLASRLDITGGGLQEEKRLFWRQVVQFLDVLGVVPSDCDNLLHSLGKSDHCRAGHAFEDAPFCHV